MATFSGCAENIVLIGFMGAGKSTVGRLLAQRTGRYFLDADALIETSAGETIASIFKKEGEEAFRRLERQSARWMAECVRGSVVSTGGGMPTVVERLRDIGLVVYLKLPFEKIAARIGEKERAKRPLFSDLMQAEALFAQRERIYEKEAQIVVHADQPPETIVEEILEKIGA
jgi:shikimate kinase